MGSLESFQRVLDRLEAHYGKQKPPEIRDPLGMILWENVAYLVNDERRKQAFDALKKRVGLQPQKILTAPAEVLWEIADLGGMLSGIRVQKLLNVAKIAVDQFQGDLNSILKLPIPKAKKALRLFPGIGEPGAEKILLFSGTLPTLTLESNGLRVLVRMGFSKEKGDYSATYRAAKAALQPQIHENCDWLIRAYQLLRLHGQQTCKNSEPRCNQCPVSGYCFYFQSAAS
jgi:endonuclease III